MSDRFLALPVLLPILGGLLPLLWQLISGRRMRERALYGYIGGLVLANSLLVAALLARGPGSRPVVLFSLFAGLRVAFRLDAMGSVFGALAAFLWPLATLYAFSYMEQEERKDTFFCYYLMTYGVTMGIALAGNLVTLYLFYEMLTLVTFPLVLFPLTKEAVRASRKYLYYSIGGAAFAFIGLVFVLVYSKTGTSDFAPGGILMLAQAEVNRNLLLFVYVLAFFGFGVKAAIFPFHGWLPQATVAPTPVTALLHAVAVVKSGAFAILRFTYFSFGAEFLRGTWAQWVVMGAALLTILYASTMSVREVHWKRRLAYSTVSNLSYILFGAAMMTPMGLAAALSHLVAHAFMKITSFFCAGAVMHQTGKQYIYELDGLGYRMPVTFGCLTVASLSLMGIPLFAGFISKWNLCQAAFSWSRNAVAAGAAGGVLPLLGVAVILYSALMTGIYMLTVLCRAFAPRRTGEETGIQAGGNQGMEKTDWRMAVPLLIFAAVILLLGFRPGPLLAYLGEIGGAVG